MEYKGNDKYKDNIFRYLFSEEKNFVQLYYDLTKRMLKPEDLEFYDTESIVVKQLKNDVAFKTKDNRLIIMVEHQSALNENMPLRFLLYYVELIKLYISQNYLNIFSRRAITIPLPEFYVVYNGTEELQQSELYLKANLGGAEEYISVRVNVANINYDRLPGEVLEREDVLGGYSYLMNRIRHYMKQKKMLLEEAIDKAVADTLGKGYLKEYLERKEFITMITKVLTIEEEIELIRKDERAEGKAEGIAEGVAKGVAEGKLEMAENLLSMGFEVEAVAKAAKLPVEKILELQKQLLH
jgi:predicted transposase YdaD